MHFRIESVKFSSDTQTTQHWQHCHTLRDAFIMWLGELYQD